MPASSLPAIADWCEAARRILPRFAFEYLEGGAEDWRTAVSNVRAFERIGFTPKVLVDVSRVDTSVSIFGETMAMPVAVGPTGLNGLFRHRAEEQLAAAAGAAGLPFVLSTASTSPIESVREATSGSLWLQLYVQNDRRIAERLMHKARAHGFKVLMLTVDTPVAGVRNHYRRNGFTLPLRWTPRLVLDVLSHPRWCLRTGTHGIPQMVNLAAAAQEEADIEAQAAAMGRDMSMTLTWDDLRWVRKHWSGPVLVKGIGSLADARQACNSGADGIVLSNHGGRQLEDAPIPIELLPQVVDAVGEKMKILVDGGIRRGSSIAKATALGAAAILAGRAPLYGVAAAGQAGVADVLEILKQELEITLRLLGRSSMRQVNRDCIRLPS